MAPSNYRVSDEMRALLQRYFPSSWVRVLVELEDSLERGGVS